MQIGISIRQCRQAKQISPQDIAARIGLSEAAYVFFEDTGCLDRDTLPCVKMISEQLRVPLPFLAIMCHEQGSPLGPPNSIDSKALVQHLFDTVIARETPLDELRRINEEYVENVLDEFL